MCAAFGMYVAPLTLASDAPLINMYSVPAVTTRFSAGVTFYFVKAED